MTATLKHWVNRYPLVIVLIVAAVLRIASLLDQTALPFFFHHRLDALYYHTKAAGFLNDGVLWGDEVIHMSPLYTLFVTALYLLFGITPWAIYLAQLLLGLLTVAFIYGVSIRLFSKPWAIVSSTIAALYGPFIFFEHQISVTTLNITLISILMYTALAAYQSSPERLGRFAVTGLILGLCILARPNALLFVLPVGYLLLCTPKARRRDRFLVLFGACMLTVLPFTIRNYLVSNDIVLVTDSGGFNFYIGNGQGANGTFRAPEAIPDAVNAGVQFELYKDYAEKAAGHPLSPKEVDAFWYKETGRDIMAAPIDWLKLIAWKMLLLIHPRELSNTHNYDFQRQLNRTLGFPLIQFGLLVLLAAPGLILLLSTQRPDHRFIGLSLLVSAAALIAFFVLAHYRAALIPMMIQASVHTMRRSTSWLKERRWRPISIVIAASVILFALGRYPTFDSNFSDEYFKLGFAYHINNQYPEAIAAYQSALARDPDHLSSLKNLATLFESIGQGRPALELWVRLEKAAATANASSYRILAAEHIQKLRERINAVRTPVRR